MAADAGAPGARPAGVLRIDYHVHTCWSYDAETSLEALLDRAREAHLSHVCVTDHDTIEGALALRRIAPPDLEVIVGCEFSTDDGSQVLGIGLSRMIHERRVLELMRAIREDGGLVLLPHPFRRGSGLFRPELRRSAAFVERALALVDLVECFNGRDSYDNNEHNFQFAEERGLPSVAGSDAHTAAEIGSVFVEYAELNAGHGRAPRSIWFSDRPRRREHALKRTAMEFYHRNAARLPAPVTRAYRVARERRHHVPPVGGMPRVQHQLSAVPFHPDER